MVRFCRKPGVFSRRVRGEWVVLEKDKLHYRELTETAGFLWEMLNKSVSEGELVSKLANEYGVRESEVADDVREFLNKYVKDGFVVQV
jgi:regulatory protein YycI of two-component signal transduction system YycFG